MSNGTAVRAFLPWVRAGLASSVTATDTLGAGVPAPVGVPLQLWLNDPTRQRPEAKVTVPLRIAGPGEVTGLDAREIVRTEPRNLANNFEPNLFPFVEFDRPDFPWLFTPARADEAGRLRPWLVLVVVRKDNATLTSHDGLPLPVLQALRSELPDLSESWAWAHAQVTHASEGQGDPLGAAIRGRPDRTVSRLLCPRRLTEQVTYLACLVPAFLAGRKTGLGEPLVQEDQELRPAWTAGEGEVPLPVYFRWEFTTGRAGDFEALVRRLKPRRLPGEVGVVAVDLSAPGWGVRPRKPGEHGTVVPFEGALRNPSAAAAPWPDDAASAFADELRPLLSTEPGGPDVTPPVYGQWHARATGVPADDAPPHWLRELNLDPRHRIAAGLGTLVVRYEQERLMAAAWDQLAAHERTMGEVTRRQLAEEIGRSLGEKHFDSMRPERLVEVAAPAVAAAGVATPEAEPAFRRLAGIGGPVATRLGVAEAQPSAAEARVAEGALAQIATPGMTERPRFAPRFDQPMYEALRDWFEGMLMPGLDRTPPNTIALLETNGSFIESFMVGLNHEFSRELVWRGFPTDRRGSYFSRFWDASGAAAHAAAAGTIVDLADWAPEGRLGDHLPASGGEGQLVLLLRGDLLRRFPRAVVYAVEAVWSEDGARRELGETERYPLFRGRVGFDLTFLGFALAAETAAGSTDRTGHPGWFFVIQEQPTEPRFGLDEEEREARDLTEIATWDALAWADLDESSEPAFVPAAGRLAKQTRPVHDPKHAAAALRAEWGANSAHMAAITQQPPLRVAVHASAWLAPPSPEEEEQP